MHLAGTEQGAVQSLGILFSYAVRIWAFTLPDPR